MGHPGKVSTPKESKATVDDINGSFSGPGLGLFFSDLFIHLYPRVLRGAAKPSGSCLKLREKVLSGTKAVKLGKG